MKLLITIVNLEIICFKIAHDMAEIATTRRGTYQQYTAKQRFDVGKFASENSVKMAMSKFSSMKLPGATIRTWRAAYEKEYKRLKTKHKETFNPRLIRAASPKKVSKADKSRQKLP